MKQFGWLVALSASFAVVLVAAVFISPLGRVRIGGDGAKPILKRWNWFAITLCTTIAAGVLLWGAAEPMFHVSAPPKFANADPNSPEAAQFAMSTLFMHWAITPYAIYTIPALAFALAYHNLGGRYSLSSSMSVAIGRPITGLSGGVIDTLALMALVAGVAGSLGAGVMTIAGGVERTVGFADGALSRFFVTIAIVATYVASSISGLHKGIKFLSDFNVRVFFILALTIFLLGPTFELLRLGANGFVEYTREFLPRSFNVTGGEDVGWLRDWTVFNFSSWAAWAPITALFLGRISVGYTVREFILINLVAPAAFSMVWMMIFGGSALTLNESSGGVLTQTLQTSGPDSVIYGLLGMLPLSLVLSLTLVFATYVSFVTAMDSNTHSISSICLKADREEDEPEGAGLSIKLFWGVLIGAVAWIMTSTTGIGGVRMLANLGGVPGVLILIGSIAAMVRFITMSPSELNNKPMG